MSEVLQAWRKDLEFCKRCGLCMPICPTGIANDWYQSKTPRGRMLLLYGLVNSELKPTKTLAERLHTCTLCGYCAVKCPSGLKLDEIFIDARRALHSMGIKLPHLEEVSRRIKESGNPYDMPAEERFMWLDYGDEKPVFEGKAGLWVGCTLSYRRPETAANVYSLLRKLMNVALVKEETCCGAPFYLAGDLNGLEEQLLKAIKVVERLGYELLITPCPSCARAFTEYAEKLGLDRGFDVEYLPVFLYKLLNEGKVPELSLNGLKVAYHDPCEAGRHMNIFDEPRAVIKAVKGIELLEMNGNRLFSNCCGGGGLYIALDSAKAVAIAERRLKDLPRDVNALVTACPSCEVNLSIAVANAGIELEVLDVAEVWHRALSRLKS